MCQVGLAVILCWVATRFRAAGADHWLLGLIAAGTGHWVLLTCLIAAGTGHWVLGTCPIFAGTGFWLLASRLVVTCLSS